MSRLENKITLITGAASGIGKSVAELFAQEKAIVILSDINDQDGMNAALAIGSNAEYVHLDVSNEKDWEKVFDRIRNRYGRLDVIVNNAAILGFSETEGEQDPEYFDVKSWNTIHDINLLGVALGCKHAIQLMKQNDSASIVNVSSRSGNVGIPFAAAYASSKAAVRNHTKTVALYCAKQGYKIRCNSIHPGAILTPMWDPILGDTETRQVSVKNISSKIPLGIMGEPDDVAFAVLYLASDESKYITGTELTIDGGILAGSVDAPLRVIG